MDVNFRKCVKRYLYICLSVTVCGSVLKCKLALVTGSAATSMERSTAEVIAGYDGILLWENKTVRCRVHRSPSLISVLIHMYPVHTLLPYFFEIHFNLTLRLLMSYIYIYIYMEHLFLMFLDHTQRRTTVGRTPLDV